MFLKKPNAFLASIVLGRNGDFVLGCSTEAGVGISPLIFCVVKMSGPQPTGLRILPNLKISIIMGNTRVGEKERQLHCRKLCFYGKRLTYKILEERQASNI
jgi:hypothetical protein